MLHTAFVTNSHSLRSQTSCGEEAWVDGKPNTIWSGLGNQPAAGSKSPLPTEMLSSGPESAAAQLKLGVAWGRGGGDTGLFGFSG